MPPTRHSTSTAHKESDQIPSDQNYTLGGYSFRIERTSVPGSSNDKIEAICTDKDGKNARKSIQIPSSTQLDGWYVEANETEATVYALVEIPTGGSKTSPLVDIPIITSDSFTYETHWDGSTQIHTDNASPGRLISAFQGSDGGYVNHVKAIEYSSEIANTYTYDGKTVYYWAGLIGYACFNVVPVNPTVSADSGAIAWTMIYGTASGGEYETKEMIIGRFAIELEDAGGVGPESDWIDPGDYDPDWEEGDPTHTLYVTVTGALSGRHNDPIVDPSYSYIPADKETVKDYGCGGDGGHGGGGGAGASTVVVHKFATNQANSKEVTAIARRHGYGSGGGKGGKGGDGCILVYY